MKILLIFLTIFFATLCIDYSTAKPSPNKNAKRVNVEAVAQLQALLDLIEVQDDRSVTAQQTPTGLGYLRARIKNGLNYLGHQFKKFVDGRR